MSGEEGEVVHSIVGPALDRGGRRALILPALIPQARIGAKRCGAMVKSAALLDGLQVW